MLQLRERELADARAAAPPAFESPGVGVRRTEVRMAR